MPFAAHPNVDAVAALRYGELEDMLVAMLGASRQSVTARFRKLRLRSFPDEMRTGTGVAVRYDLPRVLAISAQFLVNSLFVPAEHAASLVSDNWPEWARAFLAAASETGLLNRQVPKNIGTRLLIAPNAFAGTGTGDAAVSYALNLPEQPPVTSGSFMVANCRNVIDQLEIVVAAMGEKGAGMRDAFGELESMFGWSDPDLPQLGSMADYRPGSSFLSEGPYFARARRLLHLLEMKTPATHSAHIATLAAYAEAPAPIDAWKSEIGQSPERPRLKHVLAAAVIQAGLTEHAFLPSTMLTAVGPDAAANAAELLGCCEK